MTWNFSAVAFDQILNNAAKMRQMSGGQFECPIVFRGPNASARQVGSQHSHAMEHFYAHVPGPQGGRARRSRRTRRGCSRRPSATTTPCSSWSPRRSTASRARCPTASTSSPLGKAQIVRAGQGRDHRRVLAHDARRARGGGGAREGGHLGRGGRPPQPAPARRGHPRRERRARRTAASSCTRAGPTAASAPRSPTACSASRSTRSTRPILRVTTLDVPMPYNAKLEQACMPQPERVVATVQRALGRGRSERLWRRAMAKILEMPKLSPTMEEGVLSAWHKKEGDAIAVDDLLAEVETDKATMEFRSFDKGTLLKILVAAGRRGEARPAGRHRRRAGRRRLRARRQAGAATPAAAAERPARRTPHEPPPRRRRALRLAAGRRRRPRPRPPLPSRSASRPS